MFKLMVISFFANKSTNQSQTRITQVLVGIVCVGGEAQPWKFKLCLSQMTNKHTIHDCCCDNTDLNKHSQSKDEEHSWIFKSDSVGSRQKSGYALAICIVCKQSLQLPNAVSQAA